MRENYLLQVIRKKLFAFFVKKKKKKNSELHENMVVNLWQLRVHRNALLSAIIPRPIFSTINFDLCRGAREDVFPFASSTPHRRKIAIGNSSRVVDASNGVTGSSGVSGRFRRRTRKLLATIDRF